MEGPFLRVASTAHTAYTACAAFTAYAAHKAFTAYRKKLLHGDRRSFRGVCNKLHAHMVHVPYETLKHVHTETYLCSLKYTNVPTRGYSPHVCAPAVNELLSFVIYFAIDKDSNYQYLLYR